MKSHSSGNDSKLLKRFYLTELFANVVGAPLAAAYGGFMIDFSRTSIADFLLRVLLLMGFNQLVLAMPMNLFLGRRTRKGLAAWRSDSLDDKGRQRFFSFISSLPFLQAVLVFIRMFIAAGGSLLLIADQFDLAYHMVATFVFGLYASFATGIFIYYYLQGAASRIAEEFVAKAGAEAVSASAGKNRSISHNLSYFPLILPTAITSLGITLLVLAIGDVSSRLTFFSVRIVAALVMNLITLCPILIYGQNFQRRRLRSIQEALEDMAERGDTSSSLPSDLSDGYAITALRINRAFDLFRMVLSQMESASSRLSEAVMSFSSQVRETVAATTQEASAVKEVVSTMEESNRINEEIRDRAQDLSGNARESQDSVAEGFGKVQDTIHKMGEIKDANQRTQTEIEGLTDEISSIGEIIEIINGIANQTRIIAFNAELEASSAGAAGTSFRIVAEEIRRLANGTVDSLVGVKDRITQIQQGSDRLQATSEEGTAKIEEGLRLSADLNDIFMRIRAQAEGTSTSSTGIGDILVEQGQAFDQIFLTLKQISEGAEQVLASARISGQEVGKLQGLIDELKGVLTRFDYGSGGVGGRARRGEAAK